MSAEALIIHFLFNAVLLIELIDTSVGSCALLLSCIERMALGTYLHMNVFLQPGKQVGIVSFLNSSLDVIVL